MLRARLTYHKDLLQQCHNTHFGVLRPGLAELSTKKYREHHTLLVTQKKTEEEEGGRGEGGKQ